MSAIPEVLRELPGEVKRIRRREKLALDRSRRATPFDSALDADGDLSLIPERKPTLVLDGGPQPARTDSETTFATKDDIANRLAEQAQRYNNYKVLGAEIDQEWQTWADSHSILVKAVTRGRHFKTYDFDDPKSEDSKQLAEINKQDRMQAEKEARRRGFEISLARARELAANSDPLIQNPGVLWHEDGDARRRLAPFLANLNFAIHKLAQQAIDSDTLNHNLDQLAITFGSIIDPNKRPQNGSENRFWYEPVVKIYDPEKDTHEKRIAFAFRSLVQNPADFNFTIVDQRTGNNIVVNLFPNMYSRYGNIRSADGLMPDEASVLISRLDAMYLRHKADNKEEFEDMMTKARKTLRTKAIKVSLLRQGKPTITVEGEYIDKPSNGTVTSGFELQSGLTEKAAFIPVERRTEQQVYRQTAEINRPTKLQYLAMDLAGMEARA